MYIICFSHIRFTLVRLAVCGLNYFGVLVFQDRFNVYMSAAIQNLYDFTGETIVFFIHFELKLIELNLFVIKKTPRPEGFYFLLVSLGCEAYKHNSV